MNTPPFLPPFHLADRDRHPFRAIDPHRHRGEEKRRKVPALCALCFPPFFAPDVRERVKKRILEVRNCLFPFLSGACIP